MESKALQNPKDSGDSSLKINPPGDSSVFTKLNFKVPNLVNLKSIEQLRNPEFCYGEYDGEDTKKIKEAIKLSKEYKQKCETWLKLCKDTGDEKSQKAGDEKSQKGGDDESYEGSLIDEEILGWLKQISSKVPQASKKNTSSQLITRHNLSDESDTELKDKKTGSTLTNILQTICPACFKTPNPEPPPKSREDCVHVKMLSGTILILKVSESDSVKGLKEKICIAQGIDPSLQYLIHDGIVLTKDGDKVLELLSKPSIKDLQKPTKDQAASRMIYLFQLRSVLGVPKGTTVEMDATEPHGKGVKFSKEEFEGLYMWYTNGRKEPDVYRGQFKNGERASPPAVWHRVSNRPAGSRVPGNIGPSNIRSNSKTQGVKGG